MSHSAHRYGSRQELQDDFVLFVRPCKQFDDADPQTRAETLRKTRRLAEAVHRHGPVNIGRTKPGSISQGLTFEQVMSGEAMNGFMSVFVDKKSLSAAVATVKKEDTGLSVVVTGPVEDVFDVCRENQIHPHTALVSLGIWGNTDCLPSPEHLKIMTLCGHSMVTRAMIDHCVAQIRQGRMTIEAAARKLAAPCPCGIFNIPRAVKILRGMLADSNAAPTSLAEKRDDDID